MPKSEDVDITETPTLATPDELIAEALQTAEALEGSLAYVLADSKQHPGATSTPTSPRCRRHPVPPGHTTNFNAAADEASRLRRRATEVLNQSQMQAQKLLDSAQRRAAATVSQSNDQASRVIESARERAVAIVSAAQDRADELIASITTEVNRIEDEARSSAHKAIDQARQDAKAESH